MDSGQRSELATYSRFSREEWATLRRGVPLELGLDEVIAAGDGPGKVSPAETIEVYLPLSRLINLQVRSARRLAAARDEFLGRCVAPAPYVVAVVGSVAVGKSTFAHQLKTLLERWSEHPRVEVVTTDNFLRSNDWLLDRGLVTRKGFPESYDLEAMLLFLSELKSGRGPARTPLYSHETYDVVPGQWRDVERADVILVEGLNILQFSELVTSDGDTTRILCSDFVDFSIYIDAEEADIEAWYLERFLALRKVSNSRPPAYFNSAADDHEPTEGELARRIWRDINLRNLRENIVPTRPRANVIMRKRSDHTVGEIWLRS